VPAAAVPAPAATVPPDAGDNALAPLATRILLDAGGAGSGPELIQARGPLPAGWKPDPPLDLSGPMPSDADVRAAITKGVNYILGLQKENGAWDVDLTGTLLSETADEAVDAIAATSLAGIALRYHVKVDPARIEPALKRAADFVMDRVYRGKLPLKVWYANWRYTLGLKFLHMEFKATTDAERKGEIAAVSRRMVQAMLKLQLSNSEATLLERKKKARLSARMKDTAMPSYLGVVLQPPTDTNYRGGAPVLRVIPGSMAEKSGVAPGDKVVMAEGLRIENAVDYYLLESEWVGGQKVKVKFARPGGKDYERDVQLPQTWPGFLGVRLSQASDGLVVEAFLRFSPSKGELELGDVITKIDGKDIKAIADFDAIEQTTPPGKKLRVEFLRAGKKKSASIGAVAAPEGWYGFAPAEEDKGDDNGVVVDAILPGGAADRLGIKKGDRVTWIGDVPILGLDHYIDFSGTVPAGKNMVIKWVTAEGEEKSEMCPPDVVVMPGDPQFGFARTNPFPFGPAVVENLKKGGVSDKAGVKDGDQIVTINGKPVQNLYACVMMMRQIAAGDEIVLGLRRGNQNVEAKFIMQKPGDDPGTGPGVEEGGWAYYPNMGESPSFSTAAALLALYNVQNDVDPRLKKNLKDSLKAAENLIASLRVPDPQNGGAETYVYRAGSKGNQSGIDVRGCQGRNAICEMTLVLAGRRKSADLKKQIDLWVRHRGELDAVRRMEFYQAGNRQGSPHNYDRWWNAAYYWHYGHYYTLQAAKMIGGKTFKDINEICTKAVMKTRLEDGTWLDHPSFGKLVGTGLALWILGETEGGWRDGYDPTITQDKKENPVTPGGKPPGEVSE
jgi:S1-C subfamily serine protease